MMSRSCYWKEIVRGHVKSLVLLWELLSAQNRRKKKKGGRNHWCLAFHPHQGKKKTLGDFAIHEPCEGEDGQEFDVLSDKAQGKTGFRRLKSNIEQETQDRVLSETRCQVLKRSEESSKEIQTSQTKAKMKKNLKRTA